MGELGKEVQAVASAAFVALVSIAVILVIAGDVSLSPSAQPFARLPTPDEPPLELIYLDSARVDNYLGQVEGGLSNSVQRSNQLSEGLNASLSGGGAQLGATESATTSDQETVTPTAADRFYLLLRLLRQDENRGCHAAPNRLPSSRCVNDYCPQETKGNWLGDLNDVSGDFTDVRSIVSCIGVGSFIRLTGVQLFLPSYAQVLPNAQSATALYGGEPWHRNSFTSPTQSTSSRDIENYVAAAGSNPRMPFIAAPYGSTLRIGPTTKATRLQSYGGQDTAFFIPLAYKWLTSEPSLLSGSVTVVGKIDYDALKGGPDYVDYPSISEFAHALVKQHHKFNDSLGACQSSPPHQVTAHAPFPGPTAVPRTPRRPHSTTATGCYSPQVIRQSVKRSVTFRPPVVVIVPLAIYQ